MTLSDNSQSLSVPANVAVPAGATSASFDASASAVTSQTSAQVTATYNGTSKNVTLTLQPSSVSLSSISCAPTSIPAGQSTTCQLALTSAAGTDTSVRVSDSSKYLSVPSQVVVRAGQSAISFLATTKSNAKPTSVTITAKLSRVTVNTTVSIVKGTANALSVDVPTAQTSVDGESVQFLVSAQDPENLPVALTTAELPAGASFDSVRGEFTWTPRGVPFGSYPISFTATNAIGQSATAKVSVDVVSGEPVLKKVLHSVTHNPEQACSPGSLATLQGVGLGVDQAGEAVQVSVNQEFVAVVDSSPKEITFQCPDLIPGTPLSIQAYRGSRSSNVLDSVMAEAAPGVFSLDGTGSGQGLVLLGGTDQVVTMRKAQLPSQPALRKDLISILATGLGVEAQARPEEVQVVIGESVTSAQSVTPLSPGLWRVVAKVPDHAAFGDAVPLRLQLTLPGGRDVGSNVVTLAINAKDDEINQ